jgi:RAD51-like protein 3
VLWIDTTAGFSATRLVYFLQRVATGSAAAALSAVRCVKAFDIHEVLSILDELSTNAEQAPPALLVVDSVSSVVSPLLSVKHQQGHALMLSLSHALRALADERSMAVLVTNHTVGGRGGDAGSLKPALGETWKSQPHTRLHLTLGAYDTGQEQVNEARVTLGRNMGNSAQYLNGIVTLTAG